MNWDKFFEFFNNHRGSIIGVTLGFFAAIFIKFVGFFWAIFIVICMGIGYYIGKSLSEDKDFLRNLLDKILPPGRFR